MGEQLEQIAKVLGAIIAILTAVLTLSGKLAEARDKLFKPFWDKAGRRMFAVATVPASVIVPDGFLAWLFLYVAAENADRIREPAAFLSLTLEMVVVVSGYTLVWGMWLYPRLRPWVKRQIQSRPQPSASERSEDDTPVHPQPQPPQNQAGGAS